LNSAPSGGDSKRPITKLLIAGVDPGTNKAYALMDLSGKLVSSKAFKNESSSVILRAIQHKGNVIAISSDVTPVPAAVKRLAAQLGCDTLEPRINHTYLDKIHVVDKWLKEQDKYIPLENRHEKDALAAALYGYKRLKPLIKRIEDHLKATDKTHMLQDIQEKVFVGKRSITNALKDLLG